MAHILVVDDEKRIRELVRKYAEFEGHTVMEASDGMEAVSLCQTEQFDVIIMDVMMPNLDGFSACHQIKKVSDTPVIMLSARGEEYDRIHGFETGVDDYVVKPFSVKELMMRVNVVVSRFKKSKEEKEEESLMQSDENKNCFQYLGLFIDYDGRRVLVDGVEKELTFKEYELLLYFVKNKNIVLTRDQIITEIWGYDYVGDDRTLDTHIKLLRNALSPYRDLITTKRGVGYRFDVQK